jgi:hypothetical protein
MSWVARDRTLAFGTLVALLRPSAAVVKGDGDDDDDDESGGSRAGGRRRRPRSATSVAAVKLLGDIGALQSDVAQHARTMASPAAALAAFSSSGRSHEANAVAAFDKSVAERLKLCSDGVDALKALASAPQSAPNAHAAEHAHLVVLQLYALLQRVSADWAAIRQRRLQRTQRMRPASRAAPTIVDLPPASGGDDVAQTLSESERTRLTAENSALLGRLRTDVDAARELERSVARVGVLQRAFANKVAEQAEQIDHVHAVMSDARSAVARGNDELLLAAAHGVDFRIFVLMFLVTMSIALLFLDWYQ